MATLSEAKTLGGIGSILVFIPFVSLVGYVLLIVAVKDISDYLQDRAIFNDIVIAAAAGIVGALALAGGVFLGLLGMGLAFVTSGLLGVFGGLVVAWVSLVVSAVYLRRAYNAMAERLGVGTFRTAATLYLVGAALTVVVAGIFVLFVAEIMQAIAYFSIPDQPVATPSQPAPARWQGSKFCTSCGTGISQQATFCYKCGAKQP